MDTFLLLDANERVWIRIGKKRGKDENGESSGRVGSVLGTLSESLIIIAVE